MYTLTLPAVPASWIAQLLPFAGEDRRRRAERFNFQADALRCLAAEALLRHALYEVHGLELAAAPLSAGRHGKPRLQGHPGIHFSISHSGSWVVCAIDSRPVGIDVEDVRRRTATAARSIMGEEELQHYCSLGPAQRNDYFYRLWTLKESTLKALGIGLRVDPRQVKIRFDSGGIDATIAGRSLARWRLLELAMPVGAKASLCFRSPRVVPGPCA